MDTFSSRHRFPRNNGYRAKTLLCSYWPIICVALFWIVIGVANLLDIMPRSMPSSINFSNAFTDFDSLYAGGVAVLENEWNDLYGQARCDRSSITTPHPTISHASEIIKRGGQYRTAWLYPPPAAILFLPLSAFHYPVALYIWIVTNGIALLFLLCLLKLELDAIHTNPACSAILILLSGISLPVGANFNTQNISIYFALAILMTIRGIQRGATWGPAVATVFLGVTKGFSIVWMPVFLLCRQWKIVLNCVIVSLLIIASAAALGCGWSPYRIFLNDIIPAVQSGHFPVSDSFPSVLSALYPPSAPSIRFLLNCCWGLASTALYLTLYFAHQTSQHLNSKDRDAECLALMLSLLMFEAFSNVSWVFYRVHIIAFLPLLYRHCQRIRSLILHTFVGIAMCLIWLPIPWPCHAGAIGFILLIACGFTLFVHHVRTQ